ncbi:MAG TPA: NADAR family protein [Candidatus Paceibacterota bacterium]|nr:NADAR family protein [Candidatus Paceibacterota bacterium]
MLPHDIFKRYLTPHSPHTVLYEDVLYPTVEHAYHCLRYTDPVIIEEIKTASTPLRAWEISQRHKGTQRPGFSAKKVAIMKELSRAKYEQHEDVREALMGSGDLRIVKHITDGPPADGFWDDGKDGTGRNHIGEIWMELRSELR